MTMLTIHIFGKTGCAKCAILQRRVDSLLQESPYKEHFTKEYHNVLTEEGLIVFCRAQCINPNKIPAMLVSDESGYLDGGQSPAAPYTYQYLGIQTDYSTKGKGLLPPELVREILDKALTMKGVLGSPQQDS